MYLTDIGRSFHHFHHDIEIFLGYLSYNNNRIVLHLIQDFGKTMLV